MNIMQKILHIIALSAVFLVCSERQEDGAQKTQVIDTEYCVEKIKKAVKKNDKKKFKKHFAVYVKNGQVANDKMCEIFANKPKYLHRALKKGFSLAEAEASFLIMKTRKKEVVDMVLEYQPTQAFWLGVTVQPHIANYLISKGAEINKEEFGRSPLFYLFTKEYHGYHSSKQLQKQYIHLRTQGADDKPVRDHLEKMVSKFCAGQDFSKQCQQYQNMREQFEEFEAQARKECAT